MGSPLRAATDKGAKQRYNAVTDRSCDQCGAVFAPQSRGRGGRFCSARCRGAWHSAQRTRREEQMMGQIGRLEAEIADLRTKIKEGSS